MVIIIIDFDPYFLYPFRKYSFSDAFYQAEIYLINV